MSEKQTPITTAFEAALLLAQIKLLMKLNPEFTVELRALMEEYSKKPNAITKFFTGT